MDKSVKELVHGKLALTHKDVFERCARIGVLAGNYAEIPIIRVSDSRVNLLSTEDTAVLNCMTSNTTLVVPETNIVVESKMVDSKIRFNLMIPVFVDKDKPLSKFINREMFKIVSENLSNVDVSELTAVFTFDVSPVEEEEVETHLRIMDDNLRFLMNLRFCEGALFDNLRTIAKEAFMKFQTMASEVQGETFVISTVTLPSPDAEFYNTVERLELLTTNEANQMVRTLKQLGDLVSNPTIEESDEIAGVKVQYQSSEDLTIKFEMFNNLWK